VRNLEPVGETANCECVDQECRQYGGETRRTKQVFFVAIYFNYILFCYFAYATLIFTF